MGFETVRLSEGGEKMVEIRTYRSVDTDEIIQLVLHCQNDGSRPWVTIDDQPDLLHIREKYMTGRGGFWVASDRGKIVGSIGLLDCGNGTGILKKFFVYEPYRGKPCHLGRRLYSALLEHAKAQGIKSLVLDTPKNTDRAHLFYEKAGFQKIEQPPVIYDYPYEDSDFYYAEI